jgi:hypothetical protein
MVPDLIPFEAWHLLAFEGRDGDAIESAETAYIKQIKGPAFTAVINDRVIGCSGIQIIWPGVGMAWSYYTKELTTDFPVWLTRITRRVLKDTIRAFALHRVELVALEESEINCKWALRLGFKPENGKAQCYTIDKKDVIRYEMVNG